MGKFELFDGTNWIQLGSEGYVAGDVKYSIQTTDHGKWLLWTNGRILSRTTYAALYALVVESGLIAKGMFGNGDGSSTFTMGDISGRYIGTAGQGVGLTNRTPGTKIGSETISSVPTHSHTINHSHTGSLTSDSHNHTLSHTHSIAHDHENFTSSTDTHNHDLVSFTTSGANTNDIIVFEHLNQTNSGMGFPDFAASGGAGPLKVYYTQGLRKYTTSDSHSHTLNVPGFSGNSGLPSSSTTTTDSHTHNLTVDTYNGSSGSSGNSSVNVMNPGLFLNLFIFTGV